MCRRNSASVRGPVSSRLVDVGPDCEEVDEAAQPWKEKLECEPRKAVPTGRLPPLRWREEHVAERVQDAGGQSEAGESEGQLG